jgi:hypothetical protein
MALSDLVRAKATRRVRRGLYDLPKTNPHPGGALSPDIDQAARALARRYRWTIVPEGAWAANLPRLSTQVPAKIVYHSDGPNQKLPIGRRTIHFKHARPHILGKEPGTPALVIQALRYIGKKRIDDALILRSLLSDADSAKNRGRAFLNGIAQLDAATRAAVFAETEPRGRTRSARTRQELHNTRRPAAPQR